MACMIMIFLVLRKKISLQSRKLIQDTYNLPVLKGSVGIVRRLLIGTAVVEIAGAICYSFWFVPHYGLWRGIGYLSLIHISPSLTKHRILKLALTAHKMLLREIFLLFRAVYR